MASSRSLAGVGVSTIPPAIADGADDG